MSKNSLDVYGALGKSNLLFFDPEDLFIVIDPAHALYDERVHLPLDDAMVRNIMAYGVIQPIVVAKNSETGLVEVVVGRQRVKHAREANKRLHAEGRAPIRVPAIPRKGDGVELAPLMVSENELRQADLPMVKARKMRHLEAMGYDTEAIAIAFGCTTKTVENTLCLLDVSKPVQRAVESNLIGISDVKYLSRLTPAQQVAKVEEMVKAVVGKEGHARARAKRQVLQADNPKATAPKCKTRPQLLAHYEQLRDMRPATDGVERVKIDHWMEALSWVLGSPLAEPERDTKTCDLVDELASEGAK